MNRFLFLVICLTGLISVGCNDDENGDELNTTPIDQKALAQELYDKVILPDFEQFQSDCIDLQSRTEEFRAEPTIQKLDEVKDAWRTAVVRWKYCQFYNLGKIEDSFVAFTIHAWPAQTGFMEGFINDEESIDNEFVASTGSSSRGFAGMEYLLFFNSSEETLASFTVDENSENRLNYLVGISVDLTSKANRLIDIWEGEGYSDEFIDDADFDFGGSLADLVNQMIATLEVMDVRKMTKAMGQDEIAVISTEKLESPYGGVSQELLLADIDALSKAFSGDPALESGGVYLFDYLNSLNIDEDIPLSERITESIAVTRSTIQSIPENFSTNTALGSQEALDALNEVKRLTILLNPELSSRLSVIVTPNPSDGD
ncbi:MAG: imelysin family protein [Bacteroidota bacterium]